MTRPPSSGRLGEYLAQTHGPDGPAVKYAILWQAFMWGAIGNVLAISAGGFLAAGFEGSAILSVLVGLVGTVLFWFGVLLPFVYDRIRGRRTADDRAWFALTLADMLDMGTSLPDAVERLALEMRAHLLHRHSPVAQGVGYVAACLRSGGTLAYATSTSGAFPAQWPALLFCGEQSDSLTTVLRRLASLEARQPVFEAHAVVPFLFITGLVLFIASFVSTYILPTFVSLFKGMNLELPFATKVMRGVLCAPLLGGLLGLLGLLVLAGLVGVVLALYWPRVLRSTVLKLSNALQTFRLYRLQQQGIIAATLAAGLDLGMTLPDALSMCEMGAFHPQYKLALRRMAAASSDRLSALMAREPGLFEPALVWLVTQGELYGNLPEVLNAAASQVQEREEQWRSGLRAWVKAGLVFLTGAFVAIYAVGTILPLAQIIDSMGRLYTP